MRAVTLTDLNRACEKRPLSRATQTPAQVRMQVSKKYQTGKPLMRMTRPIPLSYLRWRAQALRSKETDLTG